MNVLGVCWEQPVRLCPSMYKILVFVKVLARILTLSQTIPRFYDPEKETFWKHCGKRRKCCETAFSPFPTMFSTLSEKTCTI